MIAAAVVHRLDTTDLADDLAGKAAIDELLAAITDDIAGDQDQLRELATAYGTKVITMREWLDAKRPIEGRIESAQRRLSRATHSYALHGLPGNGSQRRASWETLSRT